MMATMTINPTRTSTTTTTTSTLSSRRPLTALRAAPPPSWSSSSGSASSRKNRSFSLVVTNVAKAKSRDMGRAQHFREGKASQRQTLGEAQRGGKGKGKTTRSQRTNKNYKQYLSGRPTVDDVERASRGDKTKAMGVVEREAPYRLTRDERAAWERTKKRGGHGHGNGTGGGGVLEVQTKRTSALAPHRFPLVNTHRLLCDAKSAQFVVVEQDKEQGRDEILVDLSTLRVEKDEPCRRRLAEMAVEAGVELVEDECASEGEPLEVQIRYIIMTETELSLYDADGGGGQEGVGGVGVVVGGDDTEAAAAGAAAGAPPTAEELAAAESAVAAAASAVRALKDAGATNADEAVMSGVAELVSLKSSLHAMEAAAEAAAAAAAAAGAAEAAEAAAAAETERIEEEARRSLAELPIHTLAERYMRFKCPDRPTAKALSKAMAAENLQALLVEALVEA